MAEAKDDAPDAGALRATSGGAKRAPPVRLMGDPVLRRVADAVEDVSAPDVLEAVAELHLSLADFRAEHGFGRGISAPQIGHSLRFIALNLGKGPFTMFNPEITWRSEDTFRLWDDCMSFPDLLVRVQRHTSITVTYTDEAGEPQTMAKVNQALSELLQHELDHLDGVLSIDRADGPPSESVIYRKVFDADPERFKKMVDYTIEPTV